jgi:hypothetical protein
VQFIADQLKGTHKGGGQGPVPHRLKIAGALVITVGIVVWSAVAYAGEATGSDGGNNATVGVLSTSSSPGASATAAPGGGRDSGGGVGGSGPTCTYTPVELAASAGFDLAPGGPTPGVWFLVSCGQGPEEVEWVPTAPNVPTAAAGNEVSPGAAAAKAAASIVLPSPSIEVNPAQFSVVNLATWLAIDPAGWQPYRATATVAGVTATAVATPQDVTWTMGDGGEVVCDGPGSQYSPDLAANLQSTSCSYTYTRSSAGEPSVDGNSNDGAFAVTATVSWKVTWTAVGAPGGGTLPPLETSSTVAVRVEQVESIGSSS